jgi:hypothetical protein
MILKDSIWIGFYRVLPAVVTPPRWPCGCWRLPRGLQPCPGEGFKLPVKYIYTYIHTYIDKYTHTYIHTYIPWPHHGLSVEVCRSDCARAFPPDSRVKRQ